MQKDAGWRKVVGVCVFFVCQCMNPYDRISVVRLNLVFESNFAGGRPLASQCSGWIDFE